jgi:hypothetical protein
VPETSDNVVDRELCRSRLSARRAIDADRGVIPAPRAEIRDPVPTTARRIWQAIAELALVAGLFLAYKMGRILTAGDTGEATNHATTVWHLERWLHFPSELSVQHAMLHPHWLVLAANCYYAYVHFPATAACLIWLYIRRPELYRNTRRILAGLTAAALIVHVSYPLTPPRLAPITGLLDTGTLYGPAVYGSPSTDTLSNQYAAMPSMHVGWAVAVAGALVVATRGRWRWLWLAHPAITLLVVVATGNHYWLDAVVALLLLAAVTVLVLRADAWLTHVAARARLHATGAARPRRYGLQIAIGCTAVVIALVALR